jgi:hypothetical protein
MESFYGRVVDLEMGWKTHIFQGKLCMMRFLVVALFLLGCGGGSDEKANFRFINLYNSPVDLFLNGEGYVDGLVPGDFVGYDLIKTEQTEFTVFSASGFSKIGSVTRKVDTETDYTLISFGKEGDSTVSLLRDQNIPPAKTRGKFRFINATERPVDIYLGSLTGLPTTPIISNLRSRGVSAYVEGPEGVFRILVKSSGSTIFDSGDRTLRDGQIWTVAIFNELLFYLDRERK